MKTSVMRVNLPVKVRRR